MDCTGLVAVAPLEDRRQGKEFWKDLRSQGLLPRIKLDAQCKPPTNRASVRSRQKHARVCLPFFYSPNLSKRGSEGLCGRVRDISRQIGQSSSHRLTSVDNEPVQAQQLICQPLFSPSGKEPYPFPADWAPLERHHTWESRWTPSGSRQHGRLAL